jgi:hypothetical protein
VTIRRLDFKKPTHVQFFKSLPVDEKRLYVGHYIDLGDLVRFTQALLHFRQRFANIETTKRYIRDKKALDAVEFIPSDYTSQFSGRGETLIELAVRKDAEIYDFDSQAILKKVLDDIVLLKRQGKSVTVIPQGVALGHTIVEYAGEAYTRNSISDQKRKDIRRDVLNFLLTHPATEKFKTQILHTHHHLGGNLHRLNVYTRTRHGNTSIENLMRNLRITKNTATPMNTFNVKFDRTARVTPSRPTHNRNPHGLNTERYHHNWGTRIYENNNRFSTPTQRVYTSQVNSGSFGSGTSRNRSNVSKNGSANNVQQNVRLIHQLLNRANTLSKSESEDVNSTQARRLHTTAGEHFKNIQNKLTNTTKDNIKSKGTQVEAQLAAKETYFKTEGKKARTNQGQSTSNQSSQFRG